MSLNQKLFAQTRFVEKFSKNSIAVLIKFVRRVKLNNISSIEHQDSVTINNGVEAMCNRQYRAVMELTSNCILN